jgi:hypothetical protein
MSEPNAQMPVAGTPRRPLGLWVWSLVCVAVALGPIPFSMFLKRGGFLSSDTSVFAEYQSLGAVFYFGGAACCAVLLMRQSRHATAAALVVLGWVGFMLARASWGWLYGSLEPRWVLGRVVQLVLFSSLLLFAVRQQRAGVLR